MKTHNPVTPRHAALLAVAATAAAFGITVARPAEAGEAARNPQVERGRYLVTTGGCGDCHTPMKMGANGPEPDMSRMLSGHPQGLQMPPAPTLPQGPWLVVSSATNTAFSGPWGVSFTANLTPDAETGLGRWTVKDFKDTLRTGRHMGRGRAVLPPMPISAYSQMTERDMEAIFAYLRTIPAVKNAVPEPWAPAAPVAAR